MISFIKNFSNKILKCKPDAWTTRWPWVLFLGLIVHLILAAFVLFTEWDVRFDTQYEIWVSFISIIMLLALVFYLIYLLRFNVFKRFGKLSPWHYEGTFLTYFAIMALIVSWGYNPMITTSLSAHAQYNEKEVAKDINRINVLITTLEHDSIPHLWTRRKVVLDTTRGGQNYYRDDHLGENSNHTYSATYAVEAAEAVEMAADAAETISDGTSEYKGYLFKRELFYEDTRVSRKDSSSFYSMLATDSVIVINDTSYYRFYSPDYTYVTSYHDFFNKNTEEELDNLDIFHAYVKKKPFVENREQLNNELQKLIKTYEARGHNHYRYNDYRTNRSKKRRCPEDYMMYLDHKYKLGDLDEGIRNISDRYYMWQWEKLGFLIYPMYYIALALSLLLFIFRHSRKKSFFYSILAAVLLFIISGVFIALSMGRSQTILTLMLVYYVIFGVLSFGIFSAKRKYLIQDIAKNFFIYFFPILPLIITALYYDVKKDIFRSNHFTSDPNYSQLYHDAFQYEDIAMIGSQILGFVLLLLLLRFVFSKLLRKSYALPEN